MNAVETTAAAAGLQSGEFLGNGDLTIHIRVNDPDFDISASGEDTINENTAANAVGPVKISVIRGSSDVVLGYAGSASLDGVADVGDAGVTKDNNNWCLVFVVDRSPATFDLNDDGIEELYNIANSTTRWQLFNCWNNSSKCCYQLTLQSDNLV